MTASRKSLSLWLVLAFAFALAAPALGADKPASGSSHAININSADAALLEKLPQVGIKMAQRIVEFRKANGPFKRAEDLMKVKGIGPKVFARLQPLITV